MSQTIAVGPKVDAVVPRVEPLARSRAPWKRILDVSVSFTLLLLLFPVFVILAVCIVATSKGPCLYRGKRVGLGGEIFHLLKFRSMYTDADDRLAEVWAMNESTGPVFKVKHDPRITPIGRFIRRYSLDEIPQFYNVLRGEVSLVGPRALHVYEVCEFDDHALERLGVKPGITCFWQIQGRSDLTFEEWMELDRKYIREMSLLTDLKILWRTPLAVLRGEGAY